MLTFTRTWKCDVCGKTVSDSQELIPGKSDFDRHKFVPVALGSSVLPWGWSVIGGDVMACEEHNEAITKVIFKETTDAHA